jgi:sugar lactone lactonase YvrE
VNLDALPLPPCELGESPAWHAEQGALYWVDIPGRRLHRWHPASARHDAWDFDSEPASFAFMPGGALLLALRSGLERFDPATGERRVLAAAPYDTRALRFNDGRADPQGRFWVGTICDPREARSAALYRWDGERLDRVAAGISVSNGLAWSPDGATMYWADTFAHRVDAFDFDAAAGTIALRRTFAEFAPKPADGTLAGYGGRPDGAAVDVEGGYWVALYEGARLACFAPDGTLRRELPLPVRCPTMPCFGGPDLKTLYITTAREKRPADELAREPLAGCVLQCRVDVPGLPANFAHP